jgi:hypothetical protein
VAPLSSEVPPPAPENPPGPTGKSIGFREACPPQPVAKRATRADRRIGKPSLAIGSSPSKVRTGVAAVARDTNFQANARRNPRNHLVHRHKIAQVTPHVDIAILDASVNVPALSSGRIRKPKRQPVATSEPVVHHDGREGGRRRSRRGAADCLNGLLGSQSADSRGATSLSRRAGSASLCRKRESEEAYALVSERNVLRSSRWSVALVAIWRITSRSPSGMTNPGSRSVKSTNDNAACCATLA